MELTERPGLSIWLLAVRPQFLSAILMPTLLGSVLAWWQRGQLDAVLMLAALIAAAAAHAGANVLNDYYDHRSGADALNTAPLTPYAGGSRVIQRGLLDADQMCRLGWSLLLVAAVLGLFLVTSAGLWLLLIGALGLLLGYAYTAPPWSLSYRGLGELAVGLDFGPLAVAGAYVVQARTLDWVVLGPGLALGALAAAILYANQFPDQDADSLAGKRTLVVLLGEKRAACGHALWPLLAGLALLGSVAAGHAPILALLALLPLPLLFAAARSLSGRLARGEDLLPVIRQTIGTHTLVSALLLLAYSADHLLGA